jgi:hypothetical protein
MPSKPT